MKRYALSALLAVALAAGAGYWITRPATDGAALPHLAAQAQSADAAAEIDTSTIRDMALGAEDAPVTFIEYASFTCPHCADFHAEVYPRLKEDYVDTGKVRYIHREVYFDRYGLWAGMVARCGGGERYFGIADMVYDGQRDWSRGEPEQVVQNLRRFGLAAGLTEEELDACLSDGTKAQTLIAWYTENAEADGIEATPSFVINGRTYRNMPYADLREVLDRELGG